MRGLAYVLQILILVHTVDNRDVVINAQQIVSISKPKELVTHEAECIIAFVDGKFLTTRESCMDIIRKFNVEDAKEK